MIWSRVEMTSRVTLRALPFTTTAMRSGAAGTLRGLSGGEDGVSAIGSKTLAREARSRRVRRSWKTRSRSSGEATRHRNKPAEPARVGSQDAGVARLLPIRAPKDSDRSLPKWVAGAPNPSFRQPDTIRTFTAPANERT